LRIKVKVCDAIMGAGKSQSAIHYMNTHNDHFVYLTPYLDEVDRIKRQCFGKNFISPENKGGGKLDNLHHLLARQCNVSSTHALFSAYNNYTMELIRNGDYILILDEVFGVLEEMNIKKSDISVMFSSGLACMDDDGQHVKWLADNYDGTKFADIMLKAKTHNLIYFNNSMMFWTFPIEIFNAFKEVIVLTYLFDAQIQKYYYDYNNVNIEYIGVSCKDEQYSFTSKNIAPKSKYDLKSLIHIEDSDKLNRIGGDGNALSSSWFKRDKRTKEKPLIGILRNNIYNYLHNKTGSVDGDTMWTVFKDYRALVKGKGYSSRFVSCNIRATNEYRNCTKLAYCINVFFNPNIKNYFLSHNIEVDEDTYALSEMIQWIWRSAIRDGKEIWVYVPSKRMRSLLTNWIDDVNCKENTLYP